MNNQIISEENAEGAVEMPPCQVCGNPIVKDALFCAKCNKYQSRWRRGLVFFAQVGGILTLVPTVITLLFTGVTSSYDRIFNPRISLIDFHSVRESSFLAEQGRVGILNALTLSYTGEDNRGRLNPEMNYEISINPGSLISDSTLPVEEGGTERILFMEKALEELSPSWSCEHVPSFYGETVKDAEITDFEEEELFAKGFINTTNNLLDTAPRRPMFPVFTRHDGADVRTLARGQGLPARPTVNQSVAALNTNGHRAYACEVTAIYTLPGEANPRTLKFPCVGIMSFAEFENSCS